MAFSSMYSIDIEREHIEISYCFRILYFFFSFTLPYVLLFIVGYMLIGRWRITGKNQPNNRPDYAESA
jgi:hypothetical protein